MIDEYLLVAGAMIFGFQIFGDVATHNVAPSKFFVQEMWQNLFVQDLGGQVVTAEDPQGASFYPYLCGENNSMRGLL
jgi:hypothetical protein